MKKTPVLAGVLVGLILSGHVRAQPLPKLARECVGSFTLELPVEVEYALNSLDNFIDDKVDSRFAFKDGRIALNAGLAVQGEILVTSEMDDAGFDSMRARIGENKRNYSQMLRNKGKTSAADAIQYNDLGKGAFSWSGLNGAVLFWKGGKHTYRYFEKGNDLVPAGDVLSKFGHRAIFEVPPESGLCFPYGVYKGVPRDGYAIEVGLRLPSHPDVDIFIRERTFFDNRSAIAEKTPQGMIKYYMEGASRQDYTNVEYQWLKQSESNGAEFGLQAFARGSRGSGKETGDFAYLAASTNAGTGGRHPQLLISVMRNQKRARGKPVDEAFVRQLGETIASSIRSRD